VQINLAPGLAGVPLGPLVAERTAMPTYIELHSRVQALATAGSGRDESGPLSRPFTPARRSASASCSGGGVPGTVRRGRRIGHSIVQAGGLECRCGQRGCWETITSHRWLRAEALRLGLPSARTMTAGPLARLAARGHRQAADLFDQYARNLAIGIADIAWICAPHYGRHLVHTQILQPLGITEDKTLTAFGLELGHLGASDQVVALEHLLVTGAAHIGAHVLLLGAGVGMTWTAAVLRITANITPPTHTGAASRLEEKCTAQHEKGWG
jgi:predicted NBD/HSP70 family sugar kinase